MPSFVNGLELSGAFYHEAVLPIVESVVPGLRHSAALLGDGSEVLGFDDPVSTDHDWGPRVMLFLEAEDLARHGESLDQALRSGLPHTFGGYPTSFTPPDPADNGTRTLTPTAKGPVSHRVEVLTVDGWLSGYLGTDAAHEPDAIDWLTFPEQKLLGVTAGAVYRDDIGLEELRGRLRYYPRDVWLYMLACGWTRIGQEEHLFARAGIAGDEVGSAIIGARLVRDSMRLCFLMERTYAPYAKWFGSAFARLACAPAMLPALTAALRAEEWREREECLCASSRRLAEMHNALGLTEPLETNVRPFFGRPFRVIGGERVATALRERIDDPVLRRLASERPIGSIDQFSDSTDLRCRADVRPALRAVYYCGQ